MTRPNPIVPTVATLFLALALGACSVKDSMVARHAPAEMTGLSEVDLESCIGVPDQHANFGSTTVDTWNFSSASSTSYTIPIIGGLGQSNGGNCKATFRIEDGRVARVMYSGEKNALFAPDAYCASIVRTCTEWLYRHPQPRHLKLPAEASSVPAERVLPGAPQTQAGAGAGETIAAGTGEAAPEPGHGGNPGFPVGTAPR